MKNAFLLLACSATLPAQQLPVMPSQFQPAQSLAVGRGGRGVVVAAPRAEKGKPFSATVTSQTVQTYIDGTHVSRTTTMLEYRDAEGRVRTEISQTGASAVSIMIRDNVAGSSYRLDPVTKSAIKISVAAVPVPVGKPREDVIVAAEPGRGTKSNPNVMVEDLGNAVVNGVQAHGTRITTIVPAGEIGNDREFRSVDERWFSTELNLLVKSENTDPRFGKTTYELTNISRQPPDPSLFQLPLDYTVSTNGRGR